MSLNIRDYLHPTQDDVKYKQQYCSNGVTFIFSVGQDDNNEVMHDFICKVREWVDNTEIIKYWDKMRDGCIVCYANSQGRPSGCIINVDKEHEDLVEKSILMDHLKGDMKYSVIKFNFDYTEKNLQHFNNLFETA